MYSTYFNDNLATYDILRFVVPNFVDEVETDIDQGQSPGCKLYFHLQPCSCSKECGVGSHLCLT